MRCPACTLVFCVPAIVGNATVWHRECNAALLLALSAEGVDSCARGVVVFCQETNRLEVRTGAER
jgi:hypothetical protein